MVIRVVITWKRRFDTGIFQDSRVKTPLAISMRTKTTHSVVKPVSPAT